MPSSRRKLLQAVALASLGLTGYSLNRGLRLPPFHWDPFPPSTKFNVEGTLDATGSDLIQTAGLPFYDACFRAYAPEPKLTIKRGPSKTLDLCVRNIANDATLQYDHSQVSTTESTEGITRLIRLTLKTDAPVQLQWKLPRLGRYQFAAIGDTGGDRELAWCIQRAADLGARFLLHLGDFNYQPGDYQRSIDLFNSSPIPVYVSIGNHDFHENGAIYGTFLEQIGPLNHTFTIGKTRYVNIDTAATTFPYSSGSRGALISTIAEQEGHSDTVVFTHRPLHDPIPNSTHDIGNDSERDWLIKSLHRIGAKTLLSGHIHIYNRSDFLGIDNIIAGQGLGHQDLIVNRDYSKIVIGSVTPDGLVNYHPEPLAMPMEVHCHPRTNSVKESLVNAPHWKDIQKIQQNCGN